MADSKRDRARWPLSFQMTPTGHRFWSHRLYRGPQDQPVKVLYSRTKLESEEIAHDFLHEKVLGFDMEWPQTDQNPNAPLQMRVGLIQIACEDKIALFHIGLHSGSTAKDLLAPALRRIIEDPAIKKCGVAVHNADFARLQQWFGLHPRGAFELSHLHNLVTYGAHDPTKCTRKLVKLKGQVEQHLGLPLNKGEVRTSNWSKPLNQDQVEYAAADAYAGFMLYHFMNAKRADMDPSPPLPVYAEAYGHATQSKKQRRKLLQLEPVDGNAGSICVVDFYTTPREASRTQSDVQPAEREAGPQKSDQAAEEQNLHRPLDDACEYVRIGRRGKHVLFAKAADVGVDVIQQLRNQHAAEEQRTETAGGTSPPDVEPKSSKAKTVEPTVAPGILDKARTELLFQKLKKHRRDLAKERKCAAFIIAHDTHLHAISRKCPRSDIDLLGIKGIGKSKVADCGPAWLAIVRDFVKDLDTDAPQRKDSDQRIFSTAPTASDPRTSASQVHIDQTIQPAPFLHTGVSFSMQNASLEPEKIGEEVVDSLGDSDASDDGSAFGSPLTKPSPSVLKRKREEVESEQNAASVRSGQMQSKYAKFPPQSSSVATIARSSTILSTPPRQNTDSAHASPCPPTALKGMGPTHHPTARPQIDSPSTARQSNASGGQRKILRNKIEAFNRFVTTTVKLPGDTIEHLVNNLPGTMQELLAVPGIMPFANECSRANRDLLGFLVKSAPAAT
ncbi:hypothetical protein diail_5454 [Diaporthe ilicicola]|nr:hypothetical protein diail_5454 [Diaporthe ilicicola]